MKTTDVDLILNPQFTPKKIEIREKQFNGGNVIGMYTNELNTKVNCFTHL